MTDEHPRSKVLLVEDDSVFRMLVNRLVSEDFEIHEAICLDAARHSLSSQRFGCVLLDYRLPDGNGLQLLPDAILLDLPVVMMTAMGHEQLAVDAIKQGCHDYLIKDDLTRASLCRSLSNAMRHVQTERQAMRQRIAFQQIVQAAADRCRTTTEELREKIATNQAVSGEDHLLNRLDHMMDGLVAYASMTSIAWMPEMVVLTEAVQDAIDEMESQNDEVVTEGPESPLPTIRTDRHAVKAIVRSLLEFASLHHQHSARTPLRVKMNKEDSKAKIQVEFLADCSSIQPLQDNLSPQAALLRGASDSVGLEVSRLLVEHLRGRLWVEVVGEKVLICFALPFQDEFDEVSRGVKFSRGSF